MRKCPPIVLALLLASPASPSICAAQSTRAASAEQRAQTELRVLVACLSGYREQTRQEAFEKLLLRGEAAEKILVEKLPAVSNDPYVRGRYEQLLSRIDDERRMRTSLTPTRVTVHVENAPARDVFASICKQAGAPPSPQGLPATQWTPAGDQPVTLDLDDVPFWDAVRALAKQTGLPSTPVAIQGPFMIVPQVSAGAPKIESVRIFREPKIKLAWYAQQVKVIEARDQFGSPLVYAESPARTYAQSEVLQVSVPRETGNRRMLHLTGSVSAGVVARRETVRFENFQSSVHFDDFGRRFSMRLFRGERGHFLRVWLPPRWGDERDAAGFCPVLFDANNTALPPSPRPRRASAGMAWDWIFEPSVDGGDRVFGEPQTLEMEIPVLTREIEIPFQFDIAPAPKR